jgi:hypothetical protein
MWPLSPLKQRQLEWVTHRLFQIKLVLERFFAARMGDRQTAFAIRFAAKFSRKFSKELSFYGDSRHTNASGHDY